MAIEDPSELDRIDQEIRINELRERAREISGGEMASFQDPHLPPDVAEEFWNNVMSVEEAPASTHAVELSRAGLHFPPAAEMDDAQLHAKLWELIAALEKRCTYLSSTDHLSDRELYIHLTEQSLHELGPEFPPGSGWRRHLDILGSGSEEDMLIYHSYYANDKNRAEWMQSFPDYIMPEKKPRPYDRDRLLPIPPEERERLAWLADMHAQGYTDEDINRMHEEELEREYPEMFKKDADEEERET